jgi:hypothetical protein
LFLLGGRIAPSAACRVDDDHHNDDTLQLLENSPASPVSQLAVKLPNNPQAVAVLKTPRPRYSRLVVNEPVTRALYQVQFETSTTRPDLESTMSPRRFATRKGKQSKVR